MFDASTQSFMPLAFEIAGRWGVVTSIFDMVKRISMTRRGRRSRWQGEPATAFTKNPCWVGL